jgi:hypothetical protein
MRAGLFFKKPILRVWRLSACDDLLTDYERRLSLVGIRLRRCFLQRCASFIRRQKPISACEIEYPSLNNFHKTVRTSGHRPEHAN